MCMVPQNTESRIHTVWLRLRDPGGLSRIHTRMLTLNIYNRHEKRDDY